MKRYLIIISLIILQNTAYSQDLISKYKTGTVKLIPDTEYAQGNEWNTVFRSYYDTLYNKPIGMRKSLVLLPDGSVIVSHAYRDYHTKFSPSGKFEKEFMVEKAKQNPIKGVINGNTLFTKPDNMGKMTCSDFDGNYKKTLTLNYSTEKIIALNNGKFAVVGWGIWAEKFRSFISIVDYDTNEEKVIWEHFIDRTTSSSGKIINNRQPFNYTIQLKQGTMVSCTTMPFSKKTGKGIPPHITTVNNELVVVDNQVERGKNADERSKEFLNVVDDILVYDLDGNLKSKNKINWKKNTISVEEQKKIQQKAIDSYKAYIDEGDETVQKNLNEYKRMISEMEEDLKNINTPLAKPSFSTIIKDSDGNVLFFEIPEEKNANVFHVWVYNYGGRIVTKCTFVSNEYELNISSSKMVFHDGYIYGLQLLKETEGNPLRLVRFKLEVN